MKNKFYLPLSNERSPFMYVEQVRQVFMGCYFGENSKPYVIYLDDFAFPSSGAVLYNKDIPIARYLPCENACFGGYWEII